MHTPTYEYCAARFLNHWVEDEEKLCESLQRPSPDAIRKALSYFKVSRGFSGIGKDSDIPRTIGDLLEEQSQDVTYDNSVKCVNDLAEAIQKKL